MLRIDKAIINTNQAICENIKQLASLDRGLLSQNILSQTRNFVEYIAVKIYPTDLDKNPYDYELKKTALRYIKRRGELRFLSKFHDMLQKSASHYTESKDNSERLMLKYYEYLLKIKKYMKEQFNTELLENLCEFPLSMDTEIQDYYARISRIINEPSNRHKKIKFNDRYYVQKVKPFFVDEEIYYEVTFTAAIASVSKFDRVIAFTRCEIEDNYAVKLSMHTDVVDVLGKEVTINVIEDYEVSIRPCELDNFSKIMGVQEKYSISSYEYNDLMHFIKRMKMSLTEIVCCEKEFYGEIKKQVTARAQSTKIFDLLDLCRKLVLNNENGENVIRYLLHKMNNSIIKSQYSNTCCDILSNLFLKYGCKPFDQMPYCTALVNHNPKINDLFDSIPSDNREHELLARLIKNNTELEGRLFTPKSELNNFDRVDELIKRYNSLLYYKHKHRELKEYKKNIYILEYANNSQMIIKTLRNLSASGVSSYTSSVDSWLSKGTYVIDDCVKKEALRNMFARSHVALIYGSAGTGKSTLINHISNFWSEKNKLFLANTHPAVDNLRRKVTADNSEYSTIAKFISKGTCAEYDLLVIDECSTVSNSDMYQILNKVSFKLLVLVGDIYQIESIFFGNWFGIANRFIDKTSIFELSNPYRSNNKGLLSIWGKVRELNDSILEAIIGNDSNATLDKTIFSKEEKDEIILCLNYDGLYGINSINKYLQESNPNESVEWGIYKYKKGDPILFNESNIFSPLIHNNSKGKIVDIRPNEKKVWFDIELEDSINEIDALGYTFELIGESEEGKSIISFGVNKSISTDEDDDINNSSVVPFQIAYAVSIHKAQGLEYDSVKIVITNEIEERITHNIFYTAITRAKNKLKIYWTPETCKYVIDNMQKKNSNKDAYLLSSLYNLPIN